MPAKREITITKRNFGEDSCEDSIAYWQSQGVTAIWDATFEILNDWFAIRGIDPATQRIDRSAVQRLPAPWIAAENQHEK